jgi:hypothetical protein
MRGLVVLTAAAMVAAGGARPAQAGPADPAQASPPASASPASPASPPAPPAAADAAPAAAPDDDADLADIEKALAADAKEAAEKQAAPPPARSLSVQSMNPDLAIIGDLALAAFTDDGAALQAGDHDPTANGFNLQQVEVSLGSAVDPYLRMDSNIVFRETGVEVEEIIATTLALPGHLQARAGKFLTRFGRLNPTHPHTWAFVDQPLALSKMFGGEGDNGLGVELSWLSPLPWYVELVASVQDAAAAGSFYGEDGGPVDSVLDFETMLAARQFFDLSDDWSLMWGLSFAGGPNQTGPGTRSYLYGTDLFLKYRPISRQSTTAVEVQGEVIVRDRQLADPTGGPGDIGHGRDVAGYLYSTWRFAQRWGTGGRYEYGSPTYLGGHVVADPDDAEWTDDRHRVSADLTFWPTEFSRIRAQASLDMPTWRADPIGAVFLAFEFAAGAHGAHAF